MALPHYLPGTKLFLVTIGTKIFPFVLVMCSCVYVCVTPVCATHFAGFWEYNFGGGKQDMIFVPRIDKISFSMKLTF